MGGAWGPQAGPHVLGKGQPKTRGRGALGGAAHLDYPIALLHASLHRSSACRANHKQGKPWGAREHKRKAEAPLGGRGQEA